MGGRYALLVGINKYEQPGNDLNGCVNDVTAVAELLTSKLGYEHDNVRLLVDERATKKNILEHLNWLVSDRGAGDRLFYWQSSHGSQIRCRDGDELDDGLDEIICPYDMDWDDPLTDDTYAEFFKRVPDAASLFFGCDACHSGTMDRGPVGNPHPVKTRFMAPPADIAWRGHGRNLPVRKLGRKRGAVSRGGNENVHVVKQNHVLLSGCRDDQTSADAFINGRYQGAMTGAFLSAFERNSDAVSMTARQVHDAMLFWLNGSYTQVPQLTGPERLIDLKMKELV